MRLKLMTLAAGVACAAFVGCGPTPTTTGGTKTVGTTDKTGSTAMTEKTTEKVTTPSPTSSLVTGTGTVKPPETTKAVETKATPTTGK